MLLKDDLKRYKYLVRLHTICTISFLIRFTLICTDLSAATRDSVGFSIAILILELGSSLITLTANILYAFNRYIGSILFESDHEKMLCCSQSLAWNISTLTCIRCQCHREHPQFLLITRFTLLLLFEIMRFIAFILACVCANRFDPRGLGYAIVGAFSFIPAISLLLVEYLHLYRLWFDYRPDCSSHQKPLLKNGHRRFIPLSLTNDYQTTHWQTSTCKNGINCASKNLYHALMYHSSNRRYPPKRTKDNETIIGFHPANHKDAYAIAQNNFQPLEKGTIGPRIYFATSLDHTDFKANQFGAYICAEVNLRKTERITNSNKYGNANNYDTIYYEHSGRVDEFYVRDAHQIRSWIVVIDQDPNENILKLNNDDPSTSGKYVEDRLEAIVYQGCFRT